MKKHVLVTGGASGLGKAIVEAMISHMHDESLPIEARQEYAIHVFDHAHGDDVCSPPRPFPLETIDVLINCAGVNDIDWLENFTEERWDRVMNTNAKGIFLMTQACLPQLVQSKGTVINIVSNAAHVPMTCSLAYNASKGAAHIMTLQLARELTKKHGITVFGVAPNKLQDTGMSEDIDRLVVKTRGWDAEYAKKYQLQSLLTGEETPPWRVAEFIEFLIRDRERNKFLTGTVIPYGA